MLEIKLQVCADLSGMGFPKCLKAFNSQRDLDGIMEQQRTRLKPFFDNTDRVKTHLKIEFRFFNFYL